MPRQKKPRGRPVIYVRPERIDVSPEEIAEVVLRAKPKQEWRFKQAVPGGSGEDSEHEKMDTDI